MNKEKISGYTTTYNALESGFPFVESIINHLDFCDEVVIVDGYSTDGTWQALNALKEEYNAGGLERVKLRQIEFDFDRSDMMGAFKTAARALCAYGYLWQFDVDEFLPEWQFEAVHSLIRNYPNVILFDLPCITFSGGMTTVGRGENFFKWRLSKNSPGIIHGVHKGAMRFDEDGKLIFNREESDSCEYIYSLTRGIVNRFPPTDKRLWQLNLGHMGKMVPDHLLRHYSELIEELIKSKDIPVVFHYSWVDYKRKASLAKFWAKLKKTYKENRKIDAGGWTDKKPEDISDKDVDELALTFHRRNIFPINVAAHPKYIMDYARRHNWNQVDLFK